MFGHIFYVMFFFKKWNVTQHIFEGGGRYFLTAYFVPSMQLLPSFCVALSTCLAQACKGCNKGSIEVWTRGQMTYQCATVPPFVTKHKARLNISKSWPFYIKWDSVYTHLRVACLLVTLVSNAGESCLEFLSTILLVWEPEFWIELKLKGNLFLWPHGEKRSWTSHWFTTPPANKKLFIF